jgi:hypothetical protein
LKRGFVLDWWAGYSKDALFNSANDTRVLHLGSDTFVFCFAVSIRLSSISMGLFGYAFIDLNEGQKESRRDSLDLHASIAQVSIGVVLAIIQLYYLGVWFYGKFAKGDEERPSSPYAKHEEEIRKGAWITNARTTGRKLCWWFGEELNIFGQKLGRKGEVLLGIGWIGWLLVLCVQGTGNGK